MQGVLEWSEGCCHIPHQGWGRDPIIVVDYAGGYADDAWPADLLDAVMRVFYARWNASGGTGNAAQASGTGAAIRSVTVDGLTVQYGDALASLSGSDGGPVPPELAGVAALLEPYRMRLVTGV
jgi:hypothetical protein